MKKNLVEVVFILDRSGSMGGLENDTIGGYNAMISKQKKEEGEANITTVLFDDEYEMLHDRLSIKNISPITDNEYYVRGCTALLDAIGKTVNYMINVQKFAPKYEKAKKVLFIITTDGYENASREYTYKNIQKLIKNQKEKYNWEFLFIGANIDAISTAKDFGIDESHAVNYIPDDKGTELNFKVMNEAISCCREDKILDSSWKLEIENDYNSRNK